LILSEKINGDEIIQVNSQDYELYLRNFSSKAKGDLVVMDKLNQELGSSHYNLKLSSTPANINGGFIIIGEAFDIDFSFETILSSLQEKYETEVAEKMFVEGE
jgi:V/A-type H+-transporting ATPase subunit E